MSTTHQVSGELEFNRFGWIAVILLLVGCLGGVAVGLGAIQHTWALVLILIPTMVTLSMLLAVSPMKYIMNATAICVLIDVLMIVYFGFIA
jgi:hypothetical protein